MYLMYDNCSTTIIDQMQEGAPLTTSPLKLLESGREKQQCSSWCNNKYM